MTTFTQPLSTGRPHSDGAAALRESPTRGLNPHVPFLADPLHLLDHRTRERMIAADAAAAGRYLSVEHDGEALLIPLDRDITRIGRGLAADVRVEDTHVSRRHAILALAEDPEAGANLLDDRSSNGTFVNGRRVTAQRLRDGDVIRVGRAVFRYLELAAPRPRGAAEPLRRIPLGSLRQSVRQGRRPVLRRALPGPA